MLFKVKSKTDKKDQGADNMMDLKYEFYIDGEPQQVWESLISPDGIYKKMFGTVIKSTFQVGDKIEFVSKNNDEEVVHIYGKVLAHVPSKVLSYTDHPGAIYHSNHAELESRVTITLEPVGACTKLTLINDQWSENNLTYKETDQWWMILSSLKTLVETGRILDLGF